MYPVKHVRILDLLHGTPESPQEHPHKYRRTLMSPQEREIARCTANQLEMTPNSPAWLQSNLPFGHEKWLDFL